MRVVLHVTNGDCAVAALAAAGFPDPLAWRDVLHEGPLPDVEPERFRWVRVSNEDVGETGCRHWHSRPRWGVLGMLMGWWRVKLSSGCPLAGGRWPRV